MNDDLTPLQRRVLDFLVSKLEPVASVTVREVGAAFNSYHPNAPLGVLRHLERKGYIARREGKTGIRVLKAAADRPTVFRVFPVSFVKHKEAEP